LHVYWSRLDSWRDDITRQSWVAGGFGYITNSSGISGQRNGQLVARFQF
jgi:hypothetical protein